MNHDRGLPKPLAGTTYPNGTRDRVITDGDYADRSFLAKTSSSIQHACLINASTNWNPDTVYFQHFPSDFTAFNSVVRTIFRLTQLNHIDYIQCHCSLAQSSILEVYQLLKSNMAFYDFEL